MYTPFCVLPKKEKHVALVVIKVLKKKFETGHAQVLKFKRTGNISPHIYTQSWDKLNELF